MPIIAVNDTELYGESHGSGAPLVLLAGLGLDVSEMGMLSGRWQPGSASSRPATGERAARPSPLPPYSIEQTVADVTGLMNRPGLPRAPVRHLDGRPNRDDGGVHRARARRPARPGLGQPQCGRG